MTEQKIDLNKDGCIIFVFGNNTNLTLIKPKDEIYKIDRYLKTKNFTGYFESDGNVINLKRVLYYDTK